MNKLFKTLSISLTLLALISCRSSKTSDVSYIDKSIALVESLPKLDIYKPKKSDNNPVIIFIHGGYWQSGNKEIYKFLGRNFAKKGVTTVIPNYTLSPNGNYNTMAKEVAAAIKWTVDSIANHKGDPKQIYLMGHSAGGHLIALVGTNTKYLGNTEIIKGIILNDAAALDMYSYLKQNPPTKEYNYDVTWTKDEKNWKDGSPIYHLTKKSPPFLIYVGTKTYPSILSQNKDFLLKLKDYQPNAEIIYDKKKHVPMMSQFVYPWNKHYGEILKFMKIKD